SRTTTTINSKTKYEHIDISKTCFKNDNTEGSNNDDTKDTRPLTKATTIPK
ncbi:28396_t:CDS:1, partial [Gigaspora margarita]